MTCRNSKTARMRSLRPTTSESMTAGMMASDVMSVTSREAKRAELRHLFAQRRFDAHMERHVRARTSGAHARETDSGGIAVNADEFDVTAVGVQEGTDAIEDRLDLFSGNHDRR